VDTEKNLEQFKLDSDFILKEVLYQPFDHATVVKVLEKVALRIARLAGVKVSRIKISLFLVYE